MTNSPRVFPMSEALADHLARINLVRTIQKRWIVAPAQEASCSDYTSPIRRHKSVRIRMRSRGRKTKDPFNQKIVANSKSKATGSMHSFLSELRLKRVTSEMNKPEFQNGPWLRNKNQIKIIAYGPNIHQAEEELGLNSSKQLLRAPNQLFRKCQALENRYVNLESIRLRIQERLKWHRKSAKPHEVVLTDSRALFK